MVQSTDTRDREDLPHFPRLDGSLLRCVLIEPQMRSILVVVVNIRLDLCLVVIRYGSVIADFSRSLGLRL